MSFCVKNGLCRFGFWPQVFKAMSGLFMVFYVSCRCLGAYLISNLYVWSFLSNFFDAWGCFFLISVSFIHVGQGVSWVKMDCFCNRLNWGFCFLLFLPSFLCASVVLWLKLGISFLFSLISVVVNNLFADFTRSCRRWRFLVPAYIDSASEMSFKCLTNLLCNYGLVIF